MNKRVRQNRRDSWTESEDRLLASIVLEHIRTGETQLKAFQEAARAFGRTASACGFRWNAVVRKMNVKEIQTAKREHKKRPKSTATSSLAMKDAIKFLRQYDASYQALRQQAALLEKECALLRAKIERANFDPDPKDLLTPEQFEADAESLVAIMQRARRLMRNII